MEEKFTWTKRKYEETTNKLLNDKKYPYVSSLKSLYSNTKKLKKWLPWASILVKIETKHGGSCVSLFELNRWLFLVNFLISILVVIFIVVPHYSYSLDDTNNRLELNNNQTNLSDACKRIKLFEESNQNTTDPFGTFNLSIDESLLFSKCCFFNYTQYLKEKKENKTSIDFILDIFQGTGFFEENFFFYGQYSNKTTDNTQNSHVYYMGLSFASITLLSLIVSGFGMLLRLGKGLETSIINRIETISMINQSFVLWDYNLKDDLIIKQTKAMVNRFYNNEINQIIYNQEMKNKSFWELSKINLKRAIFHLLTILMFAIAGICLYFLNEFTFDLKSKDLDRYVLSIVEYLPAVAINLIILIYPILFGLIRKWENYSSNFKTNLFLLRAGFTRIASILFILINLSVNIVRNDNVCATQSSKLVQELLSFDFSTEKKTEIWCWETYVGQEFYKLVLIDLIVKFLLFMFITTKHFFSKFKFISRSDFDLESNFFDLMNAQILFWIGLYFSPFLALFAPIYFIIKFYLNYIVLEYFTNVDSKNSHMKLNTSFFLVLFFVFLLILILFSFIFTTLKPSRSCGPFRIQYSPNNDFTVLNEINNQLKISFPTFLTTIIDFIFSTFFLIILAFFLGGIILIFWTISRSQKEIAKEYLKIIEEQEPLRRQITSTQVTEI